jgi:hypothetical protein
MTKGQFGLLTLWSLAMAGSIYAYFQEGESASASDIVGTLSEKTGQVEYRRPNFSVWNSARRNQGFEKGTFVATAKRSSARITIGSKHVIDVAEDSQIVIGNPDELAARNSFFVGVLRGKLKVEATPDTNQNARPFGLAALALQAKEPSGIVIQSGSVTTSIDATQETTLSIQKELNKEPEVQALRGGAVVKNIETGIEELVGSLPTPEPGLALGFLKFDPVATPTPEAMPTPSPKPKLDADRILEAFRQSAESRSRNIVSFIETPMALKIPVQFRTVDSSVFEELDRIPEIRVAYGGAVSAAQFKIAKSRDLATLDHEFSLPSADAKKLIESGVFEAEVSPAIVGIEDQISIGSKTSQKIRITNLNGSQVMNYTYRLSDPKLNTMREQELPMTAESSTTLEKADAIFIPRSRESALTVRRLILGSGKFQLIKNPSQQEETPSRPAGTLIHFGKNRAIVATLENGAMKTNLSLARALQKSMDSDYFYSGEEQTIFSARKMSEKNWASIAQLKYANLYCAGKNRKVAGRILKDFAKSKVLIARTCDYIFEAETAPKVFEQRE